MFTPGATVSIPKAGGGFTSGTVISLNGNNTANGLDLNGDGIPDILFVPVSGGNGRVMGLDVNGDGVIDYYLIVNFDGSIKIETARTGGATVNLTTDANGNATGFDTPSPSGSPQNIFSLIQSDSTPPTIAASLAAGSYTGAQSVTLTCTDNVACNAIAYTTDGSTPSFGPPANGTLAAGNTATLTVSATTTVKYITRDAKGNLSAVGSGVYTITTVSWTQRTLPATGNWRTVTYGGGQFVAFMDTNVAATSIDGTNWIQRTLPVTGTWNASAYGAGTFVALSSNSGSNVVVSSTDGITWTQRTLPVSQDWLDVSFGAGLFIAVGYSTIAASSPDGINWTARAMPSSAAWRAVTFGNSKFVAVSNGPSTAAATSPDGINWVAQTPLSSQDWDAVTYGTIFVAIVFSFVGSTYATSPDGISWTPRTFPVSGAWLPITYANGTYYILPFTQSAISLTSTDYVHWTQNSLPVSQYWEGIKASPTTILAVGGNNSTAAATIP